MVSPQRKQQSVPEATSVSHVVKNIKTSETTGSGGFKESTLRW